MRRFIIVLLLLAGCATAGPRSTTAAADAAAETAVRTLVVHSTDDFHKHGPPAERFRNVRGGYTATAGGQRQYFLCGEFLQTKANAQSEWMQFATIQTSGYEQWIGGQSMPFCEDPSAKWLKGDLSKVLQTRLASLR